MAKKAKNSEWRKCAGVNSNTGRVKKGYKVVKGACPTKVASKSKSKSKGKSKSRAKDNKAVLRSMCAGIGPKNRLQKGYTWKGAKGKICPRKVGG